MDDPQVDLLAHVDLEQGILESLHRTGDVALENEVERLHLALGQETLQRDPLARLGQCRVALHRLAFLGDLSSRAIVVGDQELVTGAGHGGQTEHQHRTRRSGMLDLLAVLVEHGSHPAVRLPGDDRIARTEHPALDQHCRDRAAALVEVTLNGDATGGHLRVGLQVQRGVRGQDDGFEQLVDAHALQRGDVDEHGVAAVLLGHEVVLGQLLADLVRVRPFLIHLVDRDHDRDLGRLRMVQRLDGLRHHTVVGGDDKDRDVRHLRTTGTHGGERLVTRSVDEGDRAVFVVVIDVHLVGTDVLGDTTGLAADHVGVADGVEQLRLTVVDVAHDGNHWGPRPERTLIAFVGEVDVERLE